MFQVPYGKSSLYFELPPTMQGVIAVSKPVAPLENIQHAIGTALESPIGTPTLRQLASPGLKICIVFTDITRSCPDDLLVPALLSELEQAGIRDEDIILFQFLDGGKVGGYVDGHGSVLFITLHPGEDIVQPGNHFGGVMILRIWLRRGQISTEIHYPSPVWIPR